jgi:hypothetical protein
MNHCQDCGKEIGPTSIRCRKCHGALLTNQSIADSTDFDQAVLELGEIGISVRGLASMLGVSGARAHQKIKLARWRETQR